MKFLADKISDKVNKFYETGEVQFTNFLDPAELVEVKGVIKYVDTCVCGGFDGAERAVILIGAEQGDFSEILTAIRLTSIFNFSHRSVLGSLLGLGIKREVLGDIVVKENVCDIIVLKSIAEYILNNLKYVGREKVSLEEIKLEDIMVLEDTSKEIRTTVSSLRIDSVISAGFGISREKSAELVKNECVKVNHIQISSASKSVKEGDLISVRSKGRLEVVSTNGTSKSGRVKLVLKKK